MKIECYSVRLANIKDISAKAYKVTAFDGSSAIIPKSQTFGFDQDVVKSEAMWISAWILERTGLQYSKKKSAWFDSESGNMLPSVTVIRHNAKRVEFDGNSHEIDDLRAE